MYEWPKDGCTLRDELLTRTFYATIKNYLIHTHFIYYLFILFKNII